MPVAASAVPWVLMAAGVLVIAVAGVASRAAPPAAARRPERRRHPRYECAQPVAVRWDEREERTFAVDLGEGGVLLAGPGDLALGARVELGIEGGGARAGTVVRVTPQGYRAVAFSHNRPG